MDITTADPLIGQLFDGRYRVDARVARGGMATVYTGFDTRLDRIVAIKVIRAERLTGPTAIRRFQREIRASAQLNHPNIVHAIDADEVNGMHFFVMEYAEGVDLSKVVKKHGPLPIPV
ncbi:MAG: protein kinase, partial [Mycobacteriales bacterium]